MRNKKEKTCFFLCENLVYRMKKRIAIFLSLIMLLGVTLQTNAASTVGLLYGCTLSVGCDSNGVIVSFSENSTTEADEIGCRSIVLVEKSGGKVTKTISIPSGSTSGAYSYADGYLYTGAVEGRTYYATCTHYAKYGSEEKTVDGSTNEMVYRK